MHLDRGEGARALRSVEHRHRDLGPDDELLDSDEIREPLPVGPGAALADLDPATLYGGGEHGYTDYPALGA